VIRPELIQGVMKAGFAEAEKIMSYQLGNDLSADI